MDRISCGGNRNRLVNSLVRSLLIKIEDVGFDHSMLVSLAQNQEVFKALVSNAFQESFVNGTDIGNGNWCLEDLALYGFQGD